MCSRRFGSQVAVHPGILAFPSLSHVGLNLIKNTIPGLRLQYIVRLWKKPGYTHVRLHVVVIQYNLLYLKGLFSTVWRHWYSRQSGHKALHTIPHYSTTHIQLFHLANTHSPYHCNTAHYKQSAMNISCIPVMSVTSETRQDPCTPP